MNFTEDEIKFYFYKAFIEMINPDHLRRMRILGYYGGQKINPLLQKMMMFCRKEP